MVFESFQGRIARTKARGNSWLGTAILCVSLALCLGQRAVAQSSGGSFEITRHTINNGGGSSIGGSFGVTGSMAQSEASSQTASGGSYQLTGGFWANGVTGGQGDFVFSDGFEDPN